MLGKMIVHGLVAAALIGAAAVAYAQMSGDAAVPQATPRTTQPQDAPVKAMKEKTEHYRRADDDKYEKYGKYESRDKYRERHESRESHEDRYRYEDRGRRSRNN
jgi:sugar (pentulose or hexulose) kinase